MHMIRSRVIKQLVELIKKLRLIFSILKSSLRYNKVKVPSIRLYTEQDARSKLLDRYLMSWPGGKEVMPPPSLVPNVVARRKR